MYLYVITGYMDVFNVLSLGQKQVEFSRRLLNNKNVCKNKSGRKPTK